MERYIPKNEVVRENMEGAMLRSKGVFIGACIPFIANIMDAVADFYLNGAYKVPDRWGIWLIIFIFSACIIKHSRVRRKWFLAILAVLIYEGAATMLATLDMFGLVITQ